MGFDKPDLQSIKKEIKIFISSLNNCDVTLVRDETQIFDEGLLESVGLIELVVFIEENFAITVNDTDLFKENFESVNKIADLINRKLSV
jgi:acyl carrier protein